MKKFFSKIILICLVVLLVSGEVKVFAKEWNINDDSFIVIENNFVFDKSTGTIIDYDINYDAEELNEKRSINIPEEIDGVKVRNIEEKVFYEGYQNYDFYIPKTVENINIKAFLYSDIKNIFVDEENQNYSSVEGVLFNKDKTELIYYPLGRTGEYNIPEGTIKVGKGAFCSSKIERVTFPDTLVELDNESFKYSNLNTVEIPKNIKVINKDAFMGCSNIISFTVDENNEFFKSINGVLFNKTVEKLIYYPEGCENTSYVLPNEVLEIGENAIESSKIKELTLNNGLKVISDYGISCYEVKTLNIPSTLVKIGKNAIKVSASKIKLPEGLKIIDDNGFFYCQDLYDINIPSTVEYMGSTPFNKSLNYGFLTSDNERYVMKRNCLYDNSTDTVLIYLGNQDIDSYELPSGTKKIGKNAFQYCRIKNIILPDTVEDIGEEAFFFGKVETINFPEGLKRIGRNAFYGDYIKNIELPDSLEIIEESALQVRKLDSITIPKNVKEIGGYFCPSECKVSLSEENENFKIVNGNLLSKDGTILIKSKVYNGEDKYEIPEGVREIELFGIGGNYKEVIIPFNLEFRALSELSFYDIESIKIRGSLNREKYNTLKNIVKYSNKQDSINYSFIADEDVNGDGDFTILDLSLIASYYNVDSTDKEYKESYDLNKDGIINIVDIVKVALLL